MCEPIIRSGTPSVRAKHAVGATKTIYLLRASALTQRQLVIRSHRPQSQNSLQQNQKYKSKVFFFFK